MEAYIAAKEGKESSVLEEFEKVQALAKVRRNPFQYVKEWFLNRYENDFITNEDNITVINA